ncbi:hypothetical protein ITI46_04770 [Streptomyces oryzae]|uniref:Integral membrane protein n=1 Tax=Streptomyces oryzae TaxID=1434886 RepID=A0ABS3X6L0_9ACTN|nr:hypothetical protein [Streptomyces oryzae]MBO8191012.1 hypothetical protein [Streptomyces oryzae]
MGGDRTTVAGGMATALESRQQPPVSGARKSLSSLLWAVVLPASMILGAGIGQWLLWLGVVLMLAVVASAACLIGGLWHRAGAATLVAFAGFALMLFAGPAVYEVYMKTVGDPVAAVVTEVTDQHNRRGPDMFCTVEETGGDHETYEVSQQENCFGQAEKGDRVEIRKDPLGLLDPRLPDGPDQRNTTEITLGVTTGLTALIAAATFYAGQRRRRG